VADQFRKDSRIDTLQATLATLNQQVNTLTDQLAGASGRYAQEISSEISDHVAARKANQGPIGVLDEDRALGVLASQSWFVWVGQWLLRLLLVAIDTMPVLAKMLGGTTTYDQLLARQLATEQRLHGKYVAVREQRDT